MLCNESILKIKKELKKYPEDRPESAVMAALVIAQDEKGWLEKATVDFIAEILGMPPVAVWEVATFYNMYNLTKPGKYKITICTNLPCMLSGGSNAATYLKDSLGIDFNQTTQDGLFTLKEGECMGACGDAPVCLINDKSMKSFMGPEKIDKLLLELRSQS
tara:strand:- start:7 stop:489 length:483 start_codon:yes stop_codon:yes gene_type:complete